MSTSPSNNHTCERCGNTYPTRASHMQHIRRGCRGNQPNICQICDPPREFTTYSGLRLHEKKSHRENYNNDNAAENRRPATAQRLWTVDEERELAMYEAKCEITNTTEIIDFLLTKTHRTRDSLKKRRAKQSYKDFLEHYRQQQLSAAPPAQPEVNPPNTPETPQSQSPSTPATPPSQSPNTSTTSEVPLSPQRTLEDELVSTLKAHINEIFPPRVKPQDEQFKRLVTSDSQETRELAIDEYYYWMLSLCGNLRTTSSNRPPTSNQQSNSSRRKQRASNYKRAQQEWEKNEQQYVSKLLTGDNEQQTFPSSEEMLRHFRGIFGGESVQDDEHILDQKPQKILSRPIPLLEVDSTRKNMKKTSPGIDNVRLKDVNKIGSARLALLYNGMLLAHHTPVGLRKNRTCLIPKCSSAATPNKWRPITISSTIIRIMHKLLAKRMEAVSINMNQRGFQHIDGVYANSVGLHTVLKSCRSPHGAQVLQEERNPGEYRLYRY